MHLSIFFIYSKYSKVYFFFTQVVLFYSLKLKESFIFHYLTSLILMFWPLLFISALTRRQKCWGNVQYILGHILNIWDCILFSCLCSIVDISKHCMCIFLVWSRVMRFKVHKCVHVKWIWTVALSWYFDKSTVNQQNNVSAQWHYWQQQSECHWQSVCYLYITPLLLYLWVSVRQCWASDLT